MILADTARLLGSETACSPQGGRQADFLDSLGLVDLPAFNAGRTFSDDLGTTADWLSSYYRRLDIIRVAKTVCSGLRLQRLEDTEDKTRRLIRQLGGNPWEN